MRLTAMHPFAMHHRRLAPTVIHSAIAMQSQVFELMNLAYGRHEITSDYATAAWMWFESG